MEKDDKPSKRTGTPGLFSAIFPQEYDFSAILAEQADRTVAGVSVLVDCLKTTPLRNPVELERIDNEVDAIRHDMEEKLINSFSTPFDRQGTYSILRQMDYILKSSKETAKEMYVFGVSLDTPILAMAQLLYNGLPVLPLQSRS